MAKNWNVREFAEALCTGGDVKRNAIFDAGKRFPLTANLVSAIMATNGAEGFKEFLAACPDWMTMRKIESVLKDGVNVSAEEESEVVEEEAPKAEKKPRGRKAKKEAVEEETVEEEKPAKKEKKAKAPKKAKKEKVEEPEEEEDEGDEWEI